MTAKETLGRRVSALEAQIVSKHDEEDEEETRRRIYEILAQYDLHDPEKKYIEQARRIREEREPQPHRVWIEGKGWDPPLDLEYEVSCYVHLLPEVQYPNSEGKLEPLIRSRDEQRTCRP